METVNYSSGNDDNTSNDDRIRTDELVQGERDIVDTIVLPHEETLSVRASMNSAPYLSLSNANLTREEQDENEIDLTMRSVIPVPFLPQSQDDVNDNSNIVQRSQTSKDDIYELSLRSFRASLRNINSNNIQTSSSLYNPKECPICICQYEAGDDIAWSKNEKCYHAYHLDCIMGWLNDHDTCPLCREDYLCSDTNV